MLRKLPAIIGLFRSFLSRFSIEIPSDAPHAETNDRDDPLTPAASPSAQDPSATLNQHNTWAHELWVPHRGEIMRLPTRDIDVIKAERDYMRLYVGANSFLLHQTISQLERQLDPTEFVRLHRSTIVRTDFIVGFSHTANGSWSAHLRDGRWQRVGRTYLANARAIVER